MIASNQSVLGYVVLKVVLMGAWGSGSFENDDAADWVYQFDDSGVAAVETTLRKVYELTDDDYLEAPEASEAVAAAEIVAAMRDSDLSQLSDDARKALAKHQATWDNSSVSDSARLAIERILQQSELKELWEEGDDSKWVAAMARLQSRLR
ncbi:MAG: DUF4259 domain-containing protein [Anderseniella sp.]